MKDRNFFKIDCLFFLNVFFVGIRFFFVFWWYPQKKESESNARSIGDWILLALSITAYVWLAIGVVALPFTLS